jgi:hypothetical protein
MPLESFEIGEGFSIEEKLRVSNPDLINRPNG